MKLIHNDIKLHAYIKSYKINDLFSTDVSQHMKLFHFTQGDYIYQEDDELSYFFFFVDGKAKVFNSLSNGKSHLLSFYEPLEVLGDIEIITKDKVTVNVKVISDAYCIGIHTDYIKQNLLTDTLFLQFLCFHLGKKLNRCSKNSSINLLYPLENRLASYILAIETREFNTNNTLTFYDSLTEISELLGTSYRHLLRIINTFIEKGILIKGTNGYEVIDKRQLQEMGTDLYTN